MTVGQTIQVPNEVRYSVYLYVESYTANQSWAGVENSQILINLVSPGYFVSSGPFYYYNSTGHSLPTSLMAITKAGVYTEAYTSISW